MGVIILYLTLKKYYLIHTVVCSNTGCKSFFRQNHCDNNFAFAPHIYAMLKHTSLK